MGRLGLLGNKGYEFKEASSPPSSSTGGSRVRSLGQGLPTSPGLLGGEGTRGCRRSPVGNDGHRAPSFCRFAFSLRVSKLFVALQVDFST